MVAIRRTIAGRNSCPLGHARREPFRNSKEQTDCCLLYLTERRFQRQFGAKTSAPWIPECLGASGRARCLAECGAAVRQILLREGRGDIKLVSRPEIVPIRQSPGRGTAEVHHSCPDLRFQCQQISTMPWREIPTLVLTLIPVLIRDARGWLRRGW